MGKKFLVYLEGILSNKNFLQKRVGCFKKRNVLLWSEPHPLSIARKYIFKKKSSNALTRRIQMHLEQGVHGISTPWLHRGQEFV